MAKQVSDVFGVATEVRPDSYVDRGRLDDDFAKYLKRNVHVSIRGASKSGKSWLRQKAVPNAIIVQCRLGKTVEDIYREALGALGISLTVRESRAGTFSGQVEASADLGKALIAKVAAKLIAGYSRTTSTESEPLSQNIDDLRFVSQLILDSKRRLVIEDVHYLSFSERKRLSFDLKTLWDFGLYVIIVGIWRQQSLINLNSDLSTRIREFSIEWSDEDLKAILDKGVSALNIELSAALRERLVQDAYSNAGLLQSLALGVLDDAGITEKKTRLQQVGSVEHLDNAAMELAESLNTLYQSFAKRTSAGIRSRTNSTGIYAHAMAGIMAQEDQDLIKGVPLKSVFQAAKQREARILLPNLRTILQKLDQLQIDDEGRGLVVTYDEGREEVIVVDLQVLLYRRFTTTQWPWEGLIEELGDDENVYASDADSSPLW
ncbi:hypothetical protein IV500_17090 [Paeniglutamicibacter antarcticus]|uniref:Uncharacterized protein n=1 Tax=Arthrobacter terrae TaxID=2935737 RepID=A0A931CR90_9MICC|nr:hypothetical protein [Arthrobacter terrae]MBG0741090.1 hypothetical protein [Arthrobacter terrae]